MKLIWFAYKHMKAQGKAGPSPWICNRSWWPENEYAQTAVCSTLYTRALFLCGQQKQRELVLVWISDGYAQGKIFFPLKHCGADGKNGDSVYALACIFAVLEKIIVSTGPADSCDLMLPYNSDVCDAQISQQPRG